MESTPQKEGNILFGELRQKSAHLGVFRRRSVALKSSNELVVSDLNKESNDPRRTFSLTESTVVSPISIESVRGNHGFLHSNQFLFHIFLQNSAKSDLVFSAPSREEAEKWKAAIEARVSLLKLPTASTANTKEVSFEFEQPKRMGAPSPSLVELKNEKTKRFRELLKKQASQSVLVPSLTLHLNLIDKAKWKEVLVTNGLRIMAEVGLSKESPCLRVSTRLNASAERAFQLLYDLSQRSRWDGMTESAEVLKEDEDGHLRTIHCKMRANRVGGIWMAKRDYVVDSTWRREEDGTIMILETTNSHHACALEKGYVRAKIYALGVTLSPPSSPNDSNSCWMQMAIHADPGGWLSYLPLGWGREWLYSLMLNAVGLREVLDEENFVKVDFQPVQQQKPRQEPSTTTPGAVVVPSTKGDLTPTFNGSLQMGSLVFDCAGEWNLRGPTYLEDKVKVKVNTTMFSLLAMDLLEMPSKMENLAENLTNGLAHRYLQQEDVPFLFVIQFQIPPNLCLVAYFQAKPGALDSGSKFAKLFDAFIHGTDAERDARFKMIPRVVRGNFVVKSAVGQTPALLGNKLVTTYHSGKGYFEIDIDVGSSSVAGSILGVVKGYSSSLAMDMGFLLEAQTEEELPEVMLGAFTFQNLSLSMAVKS